MLQIATLTEKILNKLRLEQCLSFEGKTLGFENGVEMDLLETLEFFRRAFFQTKLAYGNKKKNNKR